MAESLRKRTFLVSLQIAGLLSFLTIVFGVIALIVFEYNRVGRDIESEVNKTAQIIEGSLFDMNLSKLGQLIQKKSHIGLFGIFDKNCILIYSTDLLMTSTDCRNNKFKDFKFSYRGELYSFNYKHDLEFISFFSYYLRIIIFLSSATFLGYLLVVYFLIAKYVLRPLSMIKIDVNSEATSLPRELNYIDQVFQELREKIRKSEEERALYSSAKKILHDIRNPVLVLKQLSKDNAEIQKQVDQISFQVKSLVNDKKDNRYFRLINLDVIINEVLDETVLVHQIRTEFVPIPDNYVLNLNPLELKNIISNLIRNSVEAHAYHVVVTVLTQNEKVYIDIQDDGDGIEEENVSKLFSPNFTTKSFGNGIGLSSIRSFLNTLGGDLELHSSRKGNSVFRISLQRARLAENVVIIEDDKYLRLSWVNRLKEINIRTFTFANISEFFKFNDSVPKDALFIIDRDLKDGERGDLLSSNLKLQGFPNLYLSTSYDGVEIDKLPWLKGLMPKDVNVFFDSI